MNNFQMQNICDALIDCDVWDKFEIPVKRALACTAASDFVPAPDNTVAGVYTIAFGGGDEKSFIFQISRERVWLMTCYSNITSKAVISEKHFRGMSTADILGMIGDIMRDGQLEMAADAAAQAPAFSWTSASVLHDDILCVQIVIDGGRPRYIGDHATLKRYITELVLNNYDAEILQRMYRYVAEEVAVIETKNAALRDIFGSDGDAF